MPSTVVELIALDQHVGHTRVLSGGCGRRLSVRWPLVHSRQAILGPRAVPFGPLARVVLALGGGIPPVPRSPLLGLRHDEKS